MTRPLKPPLAAKLPRAELRHGLESVDEYFWLRERDRAGVLEHLKLENAYTAATMKHTKPLQKLLYREMLSRIKETDLSVPERVGNHYYYSRMEKGKPYPFHCRKTGSLDAAEEILLDENALAAGHAYCHVGVFEVSPDHDLLAYSVDFDGGERYTLRFVDLRTGRLLEDQIPNIHFSVEWAQDSRTVFYNTVDAAQRPHRLHRHVLGQDPAAADLVYEEPDPAFHLGLYKTKSRRYLILQLDSKVTSEVRFLDAGDPQGTFRLIQARRTNIEYSVEHHGDSFYIVTNEGALNFRLMKTPVRDPDRACWTELLPHREHVKLDAVVPFAEHLVISQRESGLRSLRVFDLPSFVEHKIAFDEPVYTVYLNRNPEFETRTLRFTYTSLLTPRTVFDYDMVTRARELKKEEPVLGGYDRSLYSSERVFARAADGVLVPISLVYREGTQRDGKSPLLLYGYGAYGASSEPAFDSTRLSLIDRGFIYAIAHVRGGGELGRPWYEAGKLLHKRNTFSDFIACAEHLVGERYTSSDRLVIRGGSAGGMLVGAVTNMRPDLFAVVVANVPFVDVVNSMLDDSLPLTVVEWEEWGDPRRKDHHAYLLSYSPYDNVEAKDYPHMLVTTGLNDPRVAYWEPAKWVAKLRALKSDDNLLLLKTNMGAGHGGASGRYERLKELAFEFAFVLDRLGFRAS